LTWRNPGRVRSSTPQAERIAGGDDQPLLAVHEPHDRDRPIAQHAIDPRQRNRIACDQLVLDKAKALGGRWAQGGS
jgi:hypothetical protein